jgi:hypothetical protein
LVSALARAISCARVPCYRSGDAYSARVDAVTSAERDRLRSRQMA